MNGDGLGMVAIQLPLVEWESILEALEYAADDRREELKYTKDPDDRACIEACAQEWERLKNELGRYLA